MFDPGEVGPALRVLRHRRKLTALEVARRSGVTPETIGNYERGKYVPKLPTLAAVLLVLEATLCDLQRVMEGEG